MEFSSASAFDCQGFVEKIACHIGYGRAGSNLHSGALGKLCMDTLLCYGRPSDRLDTCTMHNGAHECLTMESTGANTFLSYPLIRAVSN